MTVWLPRNAECVSGQLSLIAGASELPNHIRRIGTARPAPSCKFNGVNPTVANLRAMHHAVVHAEIFGEVTLRDARFRSHSLS
jgi:hypothetical protein